MRDSLLLIQILVAVRPPSPEVPLELSCYSSMGQRNTTSTFHLQSSPAGLVLNQIVQCQKPQLQQLSGFLDGAVSLRLTPWTAWIAQWRASIEVRLKRLKGVVVIGHSPGRSNLPHFFTFFVPISAELFKTLEGRAPLVMTFEPSWPSGASSMGP